MNLRDQQPWRCTYFGAKLTFVAASILQKYPLCSRIHFQFHLFVNWTISAFVSPRLAQKSSANRFQGKSCFFWSYRRCFGPRGKFQHNIDIYIKTARVSRLCFCFLWLCWNRLPLLTRLKPCDLLKIQTSSVNNRPPDIEPHLRYQILDNWKQGQQKVGRLARYYIKKGDSKWKGSSLVYSGVAKVVILGVNLQIVILSLNFAWSLIRHIGFEKNCRGQFTPTPYAHVWACLAMGPRTVGSKLKLCQIWSYYIPFEPKFYSKQLLWEYFIVKINHFRVINQNEKVTDVYDVWF